MIDLLKQHIGKSISIGTLVLIYGVYSLAVQFADGRYLMAAEGQQTNQMVTSHIKADYEDKIMVITMKENGATEAQINAALKEKYLRRLEEMDKKK